jgi:hypothetical protein
MFFPAKKPAQPVLTVLIHIGWASAQYKLGRIATAKPAGLAQPGNNSGFPRPGAKCSPKATNIKSLFVAAV